METFETHVEDRLEETEKVQQHGIWAANQWLGKRTINMEGKIWADDSSELNTARVNLMKAFMPAAEYGYKETGVLVVQFTGLPEAVQARCNTDGMPDVPYGGLSPSLASYQIQLRCTDPKFYSNQVQTASLNAPVASGGLGFPLNFPVSFGAVNVGTILSLTNSGNTTTPFKVTFTGPMVDPAVELLTGARAFRLGFMGYTLTSGRTITIDFGERTAIDDAGNDVYQYIEIGSEWFKLVPGNNTVAFSAYTYGTGATVSYEWRNAYLI